MERTRGEIAIGNPDYNKGEKSEVDLFLSDDVLENWHASHEIPFASKLFFRNDA